MPLSLSRAALLLATVLSLAAAEPSGLALDDAFPRATSFAYGAWQDRPTVEKLGLRIAAPNSRGGCGIDHPVPLTAMRDLVPVLWVRVQAGSKAKRVFLALQDQADAAADLVFTLPPAGEDVVRVVAEGAPTIAELPGRRGDKPADLDLTRLRNYQFRGDWSPDAIDIVVAHIELIPVDATMADTRSAAQKRREQERVWAAQREEAARKKRDLALTAGAPHPSDGAEVLSCGLVAKDILAIRLQAQRIERPGLQPYVAQPGDELTPIKRDGNDVRMWEWSDSAKAFVQEPMLELHRTVDGKRTRLGVLAPDHKRYFPGESLVGTPLDTELIEDPRAYEITSVDDPAYAQPQSPTSVSRKSKPNDVTVASKQPLDHRIYLRLPAAFKVGATYTLRLKGINTAAETVTYVHDTTRATSEAVHAIHTGYRADDPVKRASFSIWLGTGGGHQHEGIDRFELLDDAGKVVHTGKPRLTKAKDATEQLITAKDFARTAVWALEFGEFATPGRYRVHVPGIGCSLPFEIAPDVWARAFRTAMLGFLHQRNGIALEKPWSDITRARTFHPDDGVRFFQMTMTIQQGQENKRGENLLKLQEEQQLKEVTGIWGGYQDAGDWDSYGAHLDASELMLELAEMHPEFAARTRLALPPEEAGNAIPDVVDEALWNIDSFRRLQLPDGGVRGGYGEGWGAVEGQTSDMIRGAGVYAPDVETTERYCGCAAKAARLLAQIDAERARVLRDSAVKAWEWLTAQPSDVKEADRRGARSRHRAFAAVELYALTGEARYRDAYLAVSELVKPGKFVEQHEASFTYARLPDAQVDAELRKAAIALFTSSAETALSFAAGNAFGVATDRPDLPMISWVGYFSTPGMALQNLPRAHYLTRDPRHLGAVVMACNYALGANPENRTYTVGVGHEWPRHPLHLDSRRLGTPAWPGITIYGCADDSLEMAQGYVGWVHQWFTFGMTPKVKEWPAQESDLDVFVSPAHCEYTVTQQIGPVAFYWGYLAARP